MKEKPYTIGKRKNNDPGPVTRLWIQYYFKKFEFSEFTGKEIQRVKKYLKRKKKYDFPAYVQVRNFLKKRGIFNEFK